MITEGLVNYGNVCKFFLLPIHYILIVIISLYVFTNKSFF